MKKKLIMSFVTGLVFVTGSSFVSAQDEGIGIVPVEMFICSYNDQKGPADLDIVIDKWNKWADKSKIDDYAAWTLTPYYFGEEQDFDVIWVGAGKDAVALGKAQDAYLANGEGIQGDFNEVLTCNTHSNFASLNYKATPKGKTPENSIMTFSDCKFADGVTFPAVSAAMTEWAQHQTDSGSTAGLWNWYPAYGGGKQEYTFKRLHAYKNLAELGADYERYGNGGGFVTYGKLLNHLISCDSNRAYIAQSRRYVQLR